MHPYLTEADIQTISEAVKEGVRRSKKE